MCCSNDMVKLPSFQPPPEPLESLMSETTPTSKHFLEKPTFKVQGQVYHRVGFLLPPSNEEPKILQIYFMGDERQEENQRCNNIPGTRHDIVMDLQQMLHQHNSYVHIFYKKPTWGHARQFDEPLANEVTVVIVGNEFDRRDIVLEKQNNQLQRVAETHRSYDALQYPSSFVREKMVIVFSLCRLIRQMKL